MKLNTHKTYIIFHKSWVFGNFIGVDSYKIERNDLNKLIFYSK